MILAIKSGISVTQTLYFCIMDMLISLKTKNYGSKYNLVTSKLVLVGDTNCMIIYAVTSSERRVTESTGFTFKLVPHTRQITFIYKI